MKSAKERTTARSTAQQTTLDALSRRLRSAMEDEELTYRALADRAGVSSGTVSSVLSGDTDPRLFTLLRIAAALGFSSLESLFGEVELPSQSVLLDIRAMADSDHRELAAGRPPNAQVP